MGTKFEGVDVLDFLGQVVALHTQHYKEDFDMDKELIPKLALAVAFVGGLIGTLVGRLMLKKHFEKAGIV